jgi:hypothetical protein
MCSCGFDPFDSGGKLESVMGGCSDENCLAVLEVWNEALFDWRKSQPILTRPGGHARR